MSNWRKMFVYYAVTVWHSTGVIALIICRLIVTYALHLRSHSYSNIILRTANNRTVEAQEEYSLL